MTKPLHSSLAGRYIVAVTVAALMAASTSNAAAQELSEAARRAKADSARPLNDPVQFTFLTKPSTILAIYPRGAYYEGSVMVPVHIWSRTSALQSIGEQGSAWRNSDCTPEWIRHSLGKEFIVDSATATEGNALPVVTATGCTIDFIPHFVVRQLSSNSAPVQTPSFNPGLYYSKYYMTLHRRTEDNGRVSLSPENAFATLFSVDLQAAHYSNGQAGCLYQNGLPDASGNCPPPASAAVPLNTNDGSFSTDYIHFGVTAALMDFAKEGSDRRSLYGSVGVRVNPSGSFLGALGDDQALTYGRTQMIGDLVGRWRISGKAHAWPNMIATARLESEYAFGRPSPYRRWRGTADASITFPALYGLGLMGRLADGWDYYNVGYGQQLNRAAIGLTIDHSFSTNFWQSWKLFNHRGVIRSPQP